MTNIVALLVSSLSLRIMITCPKSEGYVVTPCCAIVLSYLCYGTQGCSKDCSLCVQSSPNEGCTPSSYNCSLCRNLSQVSGIFKLSNNCYNTCCQCSQQQTELAAGVECYCAILCSYAIRSTSTLESSEAQLSNTQTIINVTAAISWSSPLASSVLPFSTHDIGPSASTDSTCTCTCTPKSDLTVILEVASIVTILNALLFIAVTSFIILRFRYYSHRRSIQAPCAAPRSENVNEVPLDFLERRKSTNNDQLTEVNNLEYFLEKPDDSIDPNYTYVKRRDDRTLLSEQQISLAHHNAETENDHTVTDETTSSPAACQHYVLHRASVDYDGIESINHVHPPSLHEQCQEIPRAHVTLSSVIGSGKFGTVHRGTWFSEGSHTEVAVKMLPPCATEADEAMFLKEAAFNAQLRHHPNVVHCHGIVSIGKPVMMILELLVHGNLQNYLVENRPSQDTSFGMEWALVLLSFCQQVASGMDYLSREGFVHRDLAARNVLVSSNQVCKIADFGMSRDLNDDTYYISHHGLIPVKWTAPEAIHYKKYSIKSDVWSYGSVLYEIWSCGHKPFEHNTNPEVIKLIDQGVRLAPPPGCPRRIYKIMMECWNPDRTERPTFGKLVQYFKEPEEQLLNWTEEEDVVKYNPQMAVLGGPLEDGKDLYIDLQKVYSQGRRI
ncbi:hypothetical protein EMCRGX_G004921 [Ephydatia muelleri]